jgi:plastocyanin
LALVAVAVGACGAVARADETGRPWDPAAGTAEIKGTVTLNGKAPKRKPVDMGSEPKCGEMHPEPVLTESVIVGAAGEVKNVFVWVKEGLEGWSFQPPAEPIVLDQKGCLYSPHVMGVMVGQTFKIRNSDPFAHNVHGLPRQNSEFNYGQASQGTENDLTFPQAEVMMSVKCDIHGWMKSYLGVVPHPFFQVTGEDGVFSLKGLPPGEYVIEAWHEKFGSAKQTVKVGDKESKPIEFAFEGK